MIPHSLELNEILSLLSVDPERGLSSAEAQKRLTEYGENRFSEQKKKTGINEIQEN